MHGSSDGASTTPSETFDNQTAKLGNRQLGRETDAFRDLSRLCARLFWHKGNAIALRIADPFQSHFSQNPRPIADQFSAFIRQKKISAVCARSSAKKRTLFAK